MKKVLMIAAIAALAFGFAGVAKAEQLAVSGTGTDPVLIGVTGFSMSQTSGGSATIDNLVLIFSVASGGTAPSGLSSSVGTVGAVTLSGSLGSTGDIYAALGLSGPMTPNSNNLTNFNGALTANGLPTATSFDLYEVTITGADLAAKGSITISGTFAAGTFVAGYGVDESGKIGATPFTVAGLTTGTTPTPEPASMLLLGLGLAGVPFLRRKK